MNDHDTLIEIKTKLEILITEVQNWREGTGKRLDNIERRTDDLEKFNITIKNMVENIETSSRERFTINASKIDKIAATLSKDNVRVENNKTYVWRKIFEWVVPFVMFLIGLILSKLGIVNFN